MCCCGLLGESNDTQKNHVISDSKKGFYCGKYLNHPKLRVIWRNINDILLVLTRNGQLSIY